MLDGECVCPVHRPFGQAIPFFSHDPGELASMWVKEGARRLYLADLDGARGGEPMNLSAVKKIVQVGGVPVDLGGGIRALETARRVLDLGVDRIVIGTTAALDMDFARALFESLGEKVIISVASLNGYVAVRDWQARTDERAEDFAKRMCDLGARRIVYTDVSRKGMHGGMNTLAVKRMAETLDVPVIASGGVSSLDDIRRLKALEPLGVEGVVVVTALYSGAVKLKEAIAVGESSD